MHVLWTMATWVRNAVNNPLFYIINLSGFKSYLVFINGQSKESSEYKLDTLLANISIKSCHRNKKKTMFEVFIRVWLCKHYITDFLYSVSVVVTAAHKILFYPFNTCYPAKVGNEKDVIHCFLNEYNYVKKGYIFPLPLNLLARI